MGLNFYDMLLNGSKVSAEKRQDPKPKKRNWFKDQSHLACRRAEMLIDEVTPALKKCLDTEDTVIVIASYHKRFRKLNRRAKLYGFLGRIFK